MSKLDKHKTYSVYMHTSPTGKIYVGITSYKPCELRWGTGGSGYTSNKHFWSAIKKYGWNNFKHDIICTEVSLAEACKIECNLITKYNSSDPSFGYNQTTGGDVRTHFNEDARSKIAAASRERWKDPNYRQKVIAGIKNRRFTPDQLRRISESNKRTKQLHPRTPEQTAKWRQTRMSHGPIIPWNKGSVGQYHHTEEAKAKIGARFRGIPLSYTHRQKISKATLGKRKLSEESKKKLQEIALNMPDSQRNQIAASLQKYWQEVRSKKEIKHVERTYVRSEESRRKMSEACKGRLPYNCIPIQCVETGEIYCSISEAGRQLGIADIRAVLDDPKHCRKRLHFITYRLSDESIKEVL